MGHGDKSERLVICQGPVTGSLVIASACLMLVACNPGGAVRGADDAARASDDIARAADEAARAGGQAASEVGQLAQALDNIAAAFGKRREQIETALCRTVPGLIVNPPSSRAEWVEKLASAFATFALQDDAEAIAQRVISAVAGPSTEEEEIRERFDEAMSGLCES